MMRSTALGILGMVAAFLGTAQAQDARHRRPAPQLQLAVEPSERTRPYLPVNDAGAPAVFADPGLGLPQGPIAPDVLARIEPASSRLSAATLFDQATALATQHRYLRARAAQLAAASEAAGDPRRKVELRDQAREVTQQGKHLLLRGVRTYKTLVDDDTHRSFPRMDEALFGFGRMLQEGQYLSEARKVYVHLLKHHPSSPHAPAVYLALADHLFDQGQLADAEALYRKVLGFPKARVYGYASYKLGWIQLRLQRHQEALESFYAVVTSTRNDPANASLHRAARLDFVRAYAEIGKADKAYLAFERVDRAAALEMLEELARLYLAQARLDKAAIAHRELIARAPTSRRVCAWQYAVARTMLTAAPRADAVKELENLARLRSALDQKRALPEPEAGECRANTEAMIGELGRAYHQEALKTLDPATLSYAARLYQLYLDELPGAADRARVLHLHAELRWTLAEREPVARLRTERWEQAAAAFGALAAHGGPDPLRVKDGARAAALAWMNALDVDPDVTALAGAVDFTRPPPAPPAPRPIAAREQQMLDAFDAYANAVRDPRLAELGRMRFVQATIYRRHHQLDRSVPVLGDLLRSQRDTDLAEPAALLLLDSLLQLQQIDEMLQLADRLAADAAFLAGKPSLQRAIELIRSRSLRRR